MPTETKTKKTEHHKPLIQWIAELSPWIAAFPSAWFVGDATLDHLGVPWPVALVIAAVIESQGVTSIHTSLTLRDYNRNKRKTDPEAPTWEADVLIGVYLAVTIALIVLLEIWPELSRFAPGLFPFFSITGAFNLVILALHRQRLASVATRKAEEKAAREKRKAAANVTQTDASAPIPDGQGWQGDGDEHARETARKLAFDELTKMEQAAHLLNTRPEATHKSIGEIVGLSRQRIGQIAKEISANGAS